MATDDSAATERESGPTALRIVLGAQLRRLRESVEITRADAGYNIRGSESKISRMELGRVGLKERDVADLLTMYGLTDPEVRDKFLAMVRRSNEPGWWHRFTDLMSDWFQDYVGLEEAATRILSYETHFVPGLLQTEEYAMAIASHGRPELAGPEIRRRVTLRMQRQKIMGRPGAPRLWSVLDESVLHRPIGGREVLLRQIDHLLSATKEFPITLQIVPYSLSGYAAEGPFTMLRFGESDLPDIVYLEHLSGALYLDKQDELEIYGRVFDRLTVDAETPDRSRQILLKIRAAL
ncbi:helix-turn-helix transcriptional regulator [Actinosynnema sp. NPDC020468]|uniref:helix-turn-helix domain-containing protein n=1 Tax=Actinosynnema sp. NPDC020468 TaxID=3154488 RepID=UPI0033D8D9BD